MLSVSYVHGVNQNVSARLEQYCDNWMSVQLLAMLAEGQWTTTLTNPI